MGVVLILDMVAQGDILPRALVEVRHGACHGDSRDGVHSLLLFWCFWVLGSFGHAFQRISIFKQAQQVSLHLLLAAQPGIDPPLLCRALQHQHKLLMLLPNTAYAGIGLIEYLQ